MIYYEKTFLIIAMSISMTMAFPQDIYDVATRVKASDIKDPKLQTVYDGYQKNDYFINLPYFGDMLCKYTPHFSLLC